LSGIKKLLIAVLAVSAILTAMPAMAQGTYTITAGIQGAGGVISPSGPVSVDSGASQSFIITPNSGYDVTPLSIDNYIQATPIPTATANVFQYTFQNVTASHSIYASFYPSALAGGAPQITSQPQNVSVLPGATATFAITASGNPSYQWYESTNGGSTFIAVVGATSASYTTPVTTNSDNGTEFVCEVFNNSGAFVSTNMATLTLLPYVKVQGRQLVVWNPTDGKYESYVIRGVDYEPVPIGRYSSDWGYYKSAANPNPGNLPNNIYADPAILTRDFANLQAMNANTIRIWGGDNNLETGANWPVSASSFENAFLLQPPIYGDDIYSWLLQNNYVTGNGYINVNLNSSVVLSALQAEFTDPGENYTILDVLRKAFYGGKSPYRFPNMITPTTLATAGSPYGLKVIAGFYVGPFGYCTYSSTGSCTYTLNTYNGESYDPGLNVPFDITSPYIRNDILMRFEIYVNTFKNNPNILFWAIGNENNLSLEPGNTAQSKAWYSLVNQMAGAAHAIEGANFHPVAADYGDGEFQTIGNSAYGADDNSLPNVDIWGVNIYRGQSFYDFFVQYKSLSKKPLWISEYGIDAWQSCTASNPVSPQCDANDPSYPQAASLPPYPYPSPTTTSALGESYQAAWDGGLWNEIAGNADVTIGGSIMEYSDEWWKPDDWICLNSNYTKYEPYPTTDPDDEAAYCHSNHFYFGFGPGSSWLNESFNAPDKYFNEAWWGLMGISNPSYETQADTMNPRAAYYTLQGEFASNAALPSYLASPVNGTTVNSTIVTFTWSLGRGISKYQLLVGTTQGGSDISSNTILATSPTPTSITISNIPLTGQALYVQLASFINGSWQSVTNYTYPTINFSQLSPYNQWKASNFTLSQLADPGISGDTAAPANDGIANLYKYAFNLNPFIAYSSAFQYYLLNNYFTVVYRQNLKATDVTYQIGAEDSFTGPWNYNSFSSVVQRIDANTQSVTATDSVNSTTVPMRFFEFVVTLKGGQSMFASLAVNPSNAYYSLTASAGKGGGGVISPSGINVKSGASQNFTVTRKAGYGILSVIDNGSDVTGSLKGNIYTISKINMAHTITVNFIDIQPPTVPGNLKAYPIVTTGTAGKLSWNVSHDNTQVVGYIVLRNNKIVANTKYNYWTDSHLISGINSYQVYAYDQAGNRSGLSNKAIVIRLNIR
jgi:hypothetical protein